LFVVAGARGGGGAGGGEDLYHAFRVGLRKQPNQAKKTEEENREREGGAKREKRSAAKRYSIYLKRPLGSTIKKEAMLSGGRSWGKKTIGPET